MDHPKRPQSLQEKEPLRDALDRVGRPDQRDECGRDAQARQQRADPAARTGRIFARLNTTRLIQPAAARTWIDE